MATDDQKPQALLRLELGLVGTFPLIAAPITQLSLERPARPVPQVSPAEPVELPGGSKDFLSATLDGLAPQPVPVPLRPPAGKLQVDRLRTPVVIKGRFKGTTETELPATLAWLVHYYDPPGYDEFQVPGRMHLEPDGSFQFKAVRGDKQEEEPYLDVVRHRLFGKGAVGYRLTPHFPHAPSATMEPGLIEFDHPLELQFEQAPELRIGTPLEFQLRWGWALERLFEAGYKVRLVVDEDDTGETRTRKGYRDLRVDLVWSLEDRHLAKVWRVGCSATSTEDHPQLEYPEVKEEGGYEFTYRLLLELPEPSPKARAKAKKKPPEPLPVRKPQLLAKVARPALESFSLAFDLSPEEHAPRVLARGRIQGLDPSLLVTVDVSLWYKARPRGSSFLRVHEPETVWVGEDGHFEAELHVFAAERELWEEDGFWEWVSTYKAPPEKARPEPALFATVCFSPEHLTQPKLPAHASLDFDPKRLDAFNEARGELASPEKGGSICSSESRSKAAPVEQLRAVLAAFSG